jgi:hypothetical protein
MSEKEGKILAMYDKSAPDVNDLFEVSTINHWAWSGLVLTLGLAIWLAIALINAENQRYAMEIGKCQDPVFKGSIDKRCLETVQSREHWWDHLYFALVRPKTK